METFMGFRQIRMGIFNNHTGIFEAVSGCFNNPRHLRIDRCNTEIT